MKSPSLAFQSRIDRLCPAYLQFLAEHETQVLISGVIVLYGRDGIEERNATHEVAEYLPEHVSIGNDSGDYEFRLRRDGSEIVAREDPGCFSAPSLETIHPSFPKWLAEGCPLPEAAEAPERPIPLRGRIWLLTAPPGGMKDMLALKKVLARDWSIPQMKRILENFPALLIADGHPYGVHRTLLEHRTFRPLLGFSEPGRETIHPYADFDESWGVHIPKP